MLTYFSWLTPSKRIVLTHDSDFGKLVIPNQKPFFAIVYLKPGHIQLHHTISSLDAILDLNSLHPPFIVTAKNSGNNIKIRVRHL